MKDRDNGKTLGDLKLPEGTVMKADKRNEDYIQRAELLTKLNRFTPKAESAFSEIFARFSSDGKMLPAGLASLTAVCLRTASAPTPRFRDQQFRLHGEIDLR